MNAEPRRCEVELNWVKCKGDAWCRLDTVNLEHAHFDFMEGVYIIWHGGTDARTVYVGQGIIRDRLAEHRLDARIQTFASNILYVTWAPVDGANCDAVENHIFDRLKPLVGERKPVAIPIAVNLPW